MLRGLGELHLRSVLERMASQFKLEVDTRPPRIPYRETITAKAEGHHRHKKQTGGAGQFGEVFLRIEPLPRGTGFEFVDQVKGGAIPTHADPGGAEGRRAGARAPARSRAFRCRTCASSCTTASITRSTRRRSRSCRRGEKAFIDAIAKAKPIVLEPIVGVEINCPEANTMGDITGDLSSRRGQVTGTQTPAGGRARRDRASRRWPSSTATPRGSSR